MAKWEVWNMHKHGLTHKEKYKDEWIEIPAGKYILMDYDEAVQFKSAYFPLKKDAMGQQTPDSMKMIVLKKHIEGKDEQHDAQKFVSHMDGRVFTSKAELDQHLKQFEGQEITDEVAEEAIAEEVKRGRGRPRKEQ